MDYIEEGRKVRQRIADDILKLETIKARKIKEMESKGLDKYTSELQKQKFIDKLRWLYSNKAKWVDNQL